MNFKEWYNLTLAKEHTTEKLIASEHGWDACKSEILKELENYSNWENGRQYIDINVIEKIKKEL